MQRDRRRGTARRDRDRAGGDRYRERFTVELDEPGGTARVSAAPENPETGDGASDEATFGSGTGTLGFSGRIHEEGRPILGITQE
ncbi:hypothetical protein [Halovivax sp.]|uniref:hypothetical protein n=1 Tax=Halovivax sp. TaxID=1935978 RepID=UPI0025BAFB30|nr:hypothetical protein [Halovivax sp.]